LGRFADESRAGASRNRRGTASWKSRASGHVSEVETSKNPLPGMKPWLEEHWGDVHTSLTTYARDQLQPRLPPGLRARIEKYAAVESEEDWDAPRSRFSPDARVIERPEALEDSGGFATAVAAKPLVVKRESEPETLRYIQIVDTNSGHFRCAAGKTMCRCNSRP